ncbi:MAG: acyltransferase, partial [Caulobacter sp.]
MFARNAPRRDIVGIDLLRFAAALSVLVYHLGHRAWAPPIEEAQIRRMIPDAPAYPELEPVAWLGWVGVEIFFVISGYVIASSAERASPFAFARSRALRLAPAIWVCSTITLGAVALVTGPDSETLKLYARTLALPFFPKAPWIDSVYWTLIVELVFYAMIFALLLMDAVRKIGAFAMTLGMVSSTMWFAHAGGLLSGFVDSWAAHLSLLRHGCFFAAGVLLWLLIVKRVTGLRLAVLLICVTACLLEISDLA